MPKKPCSIIVVEDECIVAKDLERTLSGMGYDVFAVARSSDDAIAQAARRCPDLVLMDIHIAGAVDGIRTAEILKRDFRVPIIYLTAYADEATVERAKKTEPHGYLVKPIKTSELISAIEVCVYKHEMETRLRERERWFSTTLESIADAVVTVDLAGCVTFMNHAAEALTGAKAAEATGKSVHEIMRLSCGEILARADTPLEKALREERVVELEEASLLNLVTGSQRVVSDSAAPVVADGRTLGAVMVFRDVTEQRKLQKQLELNDRLASMGTMAAGVAHEVNNPLSVVLSNAEFVAKELDDAQALDDVETVRTRLETTLRAVADLHIAADRIRHIMNQLRAFTRPSASSTTGVIDVSDCISWALRTTYHEFSHRARVITRVGSVPPVRADEVRLGQVLTNLLVNAAHSIAPGSADANTVTIAARVDHEGWVVVEVIDTGSGIPSHVLPHIFDPFFTTKEAGVGTGLGLSICHGIVTSLGGELRVESQPGLGSRFSVRLKAAKKESMRPPPALQVPTAAFQSARILIVDDEEMVVRMLERVLRGHAVTGVQSAEEALELIARGSAFDVIFSDVTMPTMTGVQFFEAVLTTRPELIRRIAFMSGGALTPKTDDFLRSVSNPRIDKPFKVDEILQLIQELLIANGPL